jgi:hypothetical protein
MDATPLPRRRPLAAALLAVVMAATLAGCSFETPETDRAKEQAMRVLTDAGVPVTAVWFSVDSTTNQVTAEVTYDQAASDGIEATAEAVASTLWRRSIAQIDVIDVDAGPNTVSKTLTRAQLTQRYGARPDGLVQVDGATMAKEDEDFMRGILGIALTATLVPMLLFGLGFVVVVAAVVVIVVVVTRRRPPPPPAPPGWPGYGPYQT